MASQHASELAAGDRFAFGKNWRNYLTTFDADQLDAAERSIKDLLGVAALRGKSFLDLGSGSGLFSLAARRLGATVVSIDYDPDSVSCTAALKAAHFPDDTGWVVRSGSALDHAFMTTLGQHDVVYSWGVLHHTGDMYGAFSRVVSTVAPGGRLCVAIYNDQGWLSRYWAAVKQVYNSGLAGKALMIVLHMPYLFGLRWLVRTIQRRPVERGMSLWYDMIDWVGGLPFEVAKPEAVFEFFHARGFALERLKTCGNRSGCNEFVLRKESWSAADPNRFARATPVPVAHCNPQVGQQD
jgi:2-polyprenyl-6-hydroxyphenyl methylase/3-demethylubiquinone-9 3-methyltransferase